MEIEAREGHERGGERADRENYTYTTGGERAAATSLESQSGRGARLSGIVASAEPLLLLLSAEGREVGDWKGSRGCGADVVGTCTLLSCD